MRILLPTAVLLAACSSTHVTFERDPSQREALWSLALGETRVEVRTEGKDTFVLWKNRTILFPGFDSFHGTIRLREVDLTGPRMRVRIRDDGVTVSSGGVDRFQPIDALAEGQTSVWRDGRFVPA